MRLSELKALVDAAHERMVKYREDPEVLLLDWDRNHLKTINYADIDSASNMDFQLENLTHDHDICLEVPMRSFFVLSPEAEPLG